MTQELADEVARLLVAGEFYAPNSKLHAIKDVSERLKVGRSTVFALLASGRLRSVKIGHRRLVPSKRCATSSPSSTTNAQMTPTPVKRTVFSVSRASEFLELRALQAQTGQDKDAFGDVVVKELLDNALDAAGTTGKWPVIEIHTRTDENITTVTVTDNGPGIAATTVTDILDFTMLVSAWPATVAHLAARRATH